MSPEKLHVLVATTTHAGCGIAEHSKLLQRYVECADPQLHLHLDAPALDPAAPSSAWTRLAYYPGLRPLIHLNYHAALHSRWTPDAVRQVQSPGTKVVITYHDTGVPNSDQCKALHAVADAFVVHEPCDDLPGALYWRQGVPEFEGHEVGPHRYERLRPILGTCGHDFPWKNFAQMAEIAASCGWGMLIYTPEMSEARVDELGDLNPWLEVRQGQSSESVVAGLHRCTANAFLYTCANTGTSAAIRWGIAAGKPVLALRHGRQFRDLVDAAPSWIAWVESFHGFSHLLASSAMPTAQWDCGIVALAEQDSWRHLGKKYADLYRSLA